MWDIYTFAQNWKPKFLQNDRHINRQHLYSTYSTSVIQITYFKLLYATLKLQTGHETECQYECMINVLNQ